MQQSTKKKLAIGISLTILLGVGGYFLYKHLKTKKEEADAKAKADADALANANQTSTGGSSQHTSNSVSSPFKGTDDIKKFQDWMDLKHPNWVNGKNLAKGGGYGSYGPSTQKAWKDYSTEFTTNTSAVVVVPKPVAPVKKELTVYAKSMGTPIWDNVSDYTPYRLAGAGEKLGTTDGTIVKSYSGSPFYKITWTPGVFKYVATENVSTKA